MRKRKREGQKGEEERTVYAKNTRRNTRMQ